MRRLLPILFLAASACGTTRFPSDMEARPASDLPQWFRFERSVDPGSCASPAIDPRDGTALTLTRSDFGRGDYAVQEGRYGARADELLRISCGTGRPLGLVPR